MEKMKVTVSVIVPVYNCEQYLRQMLESVLRQSLQDFELICVDDSSTDHSRDIVKEFAEQDERVHLIRQEHSNAGQARNTGIDAAKGKYLMFLDADDFFEADMLRDCVETLEKENSDIVVFAANRYNEKTGETQRMPGSLREEFLPADRPFRPTEMKDRLFGAFLNAPWNKMFRSSMIERYNIRFQSVPRANDMAFVSEALARAEQISVINQAYANYRYGGDSNSQATNHLHPNAFWEALVETRKRLEKAGLYETFGRCWRDWALHEISYNIRANRDEYARIYARALVKFEGEKEFGFLEYDREDYHWTEHYDQYRTIAEAVMPPELEKSRETISKRDDEIKRLREEKKTLSAENRDLLKELALVRKEAGMLQKEKERLESSNSYRLGRLVSWPYRKLKESLHGTNT